MADVEISYKGSQIATMSATGVKTLLTGDTFCEDDIVVSYTKPSSTLQSKTVSPTTSQQTISADSGYDGLSSVTVNAMPSGTAGTPSATKGTVSNHAVSVTPSVTNTTGYITGGTKTGTAVSVSASELVSGTLSVYSSGTKDVTNYASVSIPSGSAIVQNDTYYPPITVSVDEETGEVQAYGDATYIIAPTVTAGYVSSGTSGRIRISVWDNYQLPIYEGEHHQPPVLTVSLTNPIHSNYFDTCEIYDESSGSIKIGEITSADGSVSIILDQDRIDEFSGGLNITIQLTWKTGAIYVSTQNILCTGNVVYDWDAAGTIGVLVSGSGTVTIDSVDYNYGA